LGAHGISVSGDYIQASDYVLTLTNWRRVDDLEMIKALKMEQVEPDFAVRRTREFNARLRELDPQMDEEVSHDNRISDPSWSLSHPVARANGPH
jgi:hypothetical protein